MKRNSIIAGSLALLLSILAFIFAPERIRDMARAQSRQAGAATTTAQPETVSTIPLSPPLPDPRMLVHAFAKQLDPPKLRAPLTKPPTTVAPQPVIDAPWLRYVGTVEDSDGVARLFFKDERTGGVLKARTDGVPEGDVRLTSSDNGSCILEIQGTRTRVLKR